MEIVKPRTDTREYRRIVLRNSLEALLISDPDTDKVTLSILDGFSWTRWSDNRLCWFFFLLFLSWSQAAASMSVSVGSFSDPEGFPGLAHFLGNFWFLVNEIYKCFVVVVIDTMSENRILNCSFKNGNFEKFSLNNGRFWHF